MPGSPASASRRTSSARTSGVEDVRLVLEPVARPHVVDRDVAARVHLSRATITQVTRVTSSVQRPRVGCLRWRDDRRRCRRLGSLPRGAPLGRRGGSSCETRGSSRFTPGRSSRRRALGRPGADPDARRRSRRSARGRARRGATSGSRPRSSTAFPDGPPSRSTARLVEDEAGEALVAEGANADLIVVGSRGAPGLKAALLGSVSRHVVDHATCPVVVVKATD